ncbi:MAG: TlpA disulfide reductase family protein, partial [Bacteroidota bacterium]
TFVDEVPIENQEAISNPKYRRFLVGYLNYVYNLSPDNANAYVGQYEFAKSKLADRSLYFFQSHLLDQAFRKGEFAHLLETYNAFLLENPYEEFDQKAIDAYYFANKYAVGSPAPDFTLTDINGQPLTLSDLKGKFVYIDFWATWCRPCVAKLSMVKDIERNLDAEKIVFVHLSLERSESRWRDQVAFRNLTGLHAYVSGGLESPIIQDYNVGAIPEYFIIDPNGNFAEKSAKNDRLNVQLHLQNLMAGW